MPSPSSAPVPSSTPDARADHWVYRMPTRMQPYLRLMRADRPIGSWLLFIPCLWGLFLAAAGEAGRGTAPDLVQLLRHCILFAVGAYVMRGAGCTYNDIVDRDIDAKVARTALRPIPAGEVTTRQAWLFLAGLGSIGLVVLLQFNPFTIMVAIAALGLVAAYPFMKRITWWPQAWLGITFNWGVLVGYASIAGTLDPAAALLYGAGIFWTLGYDTIYAHQDTEDDALIGVKSTALRFGDHSPRWILVFYLAVIGLFIAAGVAIEAGPFFFIIAAMAGQHFAWQIRKLDIRDSHICLRLFKSNQFAGLLLAAAPFSEVLDILI